MKSRGLGVSITNDGMVVPSLLKTLQNIVADYAPQWEVYLRSAQCDYGIFIGPDGIWWHRDSPYLLPQLS
jgi:hypothetical protein